MKLRKKLENIINNYKNKKILIYGDIIFDRYVFGNVERISPEAPVPVVKVNSEEFRIGGAGNVASNIDSLGASGILLGIVGDDIYSKEIFKLKSKNNLSLKSKNNQTLIKTRILSKRQQIVRVDREEEIFISQEEEKELIKRIKNLDIDGIIISDYAKGTVNGTIIEVLKDYANLKKTPIIVDPKPPNYKLYNGITAITPNLKEAEGIIGKRLKTEKDILNAVRIVQKKFGTKYSIITRGQDGITAAEKNKKAFTIPVYSHEVYDVTGAGDTVVSVLLLSLVSGANLKEAIILANIAASIAIERIGTAQITEEEILDRLNNHKIIQIEGKK